MAAADQRNKNLLDQIFMADNDARHLGFQFVEGTLRVLDAEFNLVHGFHRLILLKLNWSDGVLEYWVFETITPTLHYSNDSNSLTSSPLPATRSNS